MSISKVFGKDTVIFATAEDHSTPSTIKLPPPEPAPGLILPDGEINWNCPCLGGMATGPCGVEFREAFSCFHYSQAEPKGSDCYDAFKTMQDCFSNYPSVYNKSDMGQADDNNDIEGLAHLDDSSEDRENDTVESIDDKATTIEEKK
ncbi:mitochondrial intermembrane space import and assembly protein 40-B [Condylostylus longicornis]|uniref:mitochondrial intermembrane space import and assembly protein 40-B n=1 Tax=Condylostylus longicornis TaxID=2530218 RepID=UPI00244DDB4E|nr:mitochondrial intermembrane space import and assembly protein 40-B [Condylostylus longicornis]